MPTDNWTFLESGTTGWTTISSTIIPNPNAVPIKNKQVSTQKKIELADGSRGYLTPETKYNKEPIQFSWFFQSGFTLSDKLMQLNRDNVYVKAQAHMPLWEVTGKIIDVEETLRLWGRQDYRDLTITMEQQDD